MRQPFNNPLLDSSPQLVNPRPRLAKGFPLARALANFQRSITLSRNRRLKTCSAPSPLDAKSTRAFFFFFPLPNSRSQSNQSINQLVSMRLSVASCAGPNGTRAHASCSPECRLTDPLLSLSLGSVSARVNSPSDRGEHHLDAHTLYVQFTHARMHTHALTH